MINCHHFTGYDRSIGWRRPKYYGSDTTVLRFGANHQDHSLTDLRPLRKFRKYISGHHQNYTFISSVVSFTFNLSRVVTEHEIILLPSKPRSHWLVKVSNTLVVPKEAGEFTFGNTLGYFDSNRNEIKGLLLSSVWIIFISHHTTTTAFGKCVGLSLYLQEELRINSFAGYRLSSSHLKEQQRRALYTEVFG